MECDFAIALPYQLRLQGNTGIVEDLRRAELGDAWELLERASGLLKDQLEYLPALGCFKYS
jgi:hypothetical protein